MPLNTERLVAIRRDIEVLSTEAEAGNIEALKQLHEIGFQASYSLYHSDLAAQSEYAAKQIVWPLPLIGNYDAWPELQARVRFLKLGSMHAGPVKRLTKDYTHLKRVSIWLLGFVHHAKCWLAVQPSVWTASNAQGDSSKFDASLAPHYEQMTTCLRQLESALNITSPLRHSDLLTEEVLDSINRLATSDTEPQFLDTFDACKKVLHRVTNGQFQHKDYGLREYGKRTYLRRLSERQNDPKPDDLEWAWREGIVDRLNQAMKRLLKGQSVKKKAKPRK